MLRVGTVFAIAAILGGVSVGQILRNPEAESVDLSGSWAARNFTDALGNGNGSMLPVDFIGMPLSEAGLAGALSYSQSQLSMPERMCNFYAPTYIVIGPMGLKIWNESEPRMGSTTAWVIGGWVDFVTLPIWMDGRPHPSKYAGHEKAGFSTGVWEHDVLTTYTTHMLASEIRRNGVPSSDLATMTARFSRHGDILTVTARIEDPVNLTEPYYLTRTFQAVKAAINPAALPCMIADEGVKEGVVPHFNPGKNPFVDEVTQRYGIPKEVVLGGAETMFPDIRKKIKDKFVQPGKCQMFCGGPAPAPVVN
jgi:hypothetical protein